MAAIDPIETWIDNAALELDSASLEIAAHGERFDALAERMAHARVVMLGEANHFVHEKVEFRLWWLRRLAARRRIVVGEELSWFDGRHVAQYLDDGDGRHFERMWTFGYKDAAHDEPTGILAASAALYPTALFKREQMRLYDGLRASPNVSAYFGFDIGGRSESYPRMPGESLTDEAARLEDMEGTLKGSDRDDVRAMIDTSRYTALANAAPTYGALRPAMALREEAMKRRITAKLDVLADNEQLVLLGHAFHFAKDDGGIRGVGVGPGGDQVPSLGHYIARELGLAPFVVWWIYGTGEDSQPFPDLPKTAAYPAASLNARLARRGVPMVLGTADLTTEVSVGHMYSQVVPVNVGAEADAVFFLPRVSPLR